MMMQFIAYYCWVMFFTAVSILFELPFTGSKTDYAYLKARMSVGSKGSMGWYIFTLFFVIVVGSFLWPITFYCRLKDLWYSR